MRLSNISMALCALIVCNAGLCAQDLLVRGARVITVSGEEHAEAAVLIRGGKIAAIAPTIKRPTGVPVLEAMGRVLMPGFIVAQTSNGLDRANEVVEVVPYVSVRDSMDPSRTFFEDSLRDGHLTLCVMPGERTVVGGTGLVVHPWGPTVETMTVVPDAGMKLSLIPAGNGNRAVHLAKLRTALDEARRYLKGREQAQDDEVKPSGNVTLDLERMGVEARRVPLLRMLKKEIPAFIACGTAADVVQAGRLIEEYDLDARLVLGPGTWRAASYLKDKNWPVIVAPDLEINDTDRETGKRVRRHLGKILKDAGVSFALTNRPGSLGRRYQWYQAATLVREGFTRNEALRTVTVNAAAALGLGDRKGSIEVGKDADLLVMTDDPFSGRAWVDQAIIGGRVVYERSEDPRLAELLGTGKR